MRRSASSRQLDYERERMARDHLRRMNIICRNRSYDVVIGGQRQEDGVFADPLYNGTALCQLIHALVDGSSAVDTIPCRDPHNLAEVSRNYVAALSALSDSAEVFGLSKSIFCITPEDVYVGGNPTALLELLVHLLGHCPPVEELGTHNPTWTWQPAADAPFQRDFDATRWARAERFSVQFLRRLGALPDPRRQPLPPTTQVVPGPLEAPYLRTPNQLQDCDDEDDVVDHVDARQSAEEPISLHTPSIFPFLLNGVVLGRAAQALMDGGLGTNIKAVGRNGGLRRPLIVTTNPRTLSACRANVVAALEVFNACTGIPARPFDTLVADVVSGHRQSIVNMLLNLANKFMSDAEAAKEVGASAPPPPPQAASTLRQPGMMRRAATPSTMDERTNPRPAIRVTAVRPPPQPLTARQPVEMDEMMLGEEGRFTAKEVRQLGSWLRSVLGDDFLYAAEDDSFSISMTHFSFVAPCMVFSDGVVLAHMIRALECRRCDALECVKPTSKTAAKRFNVRRCIDFLRTERRARFLLPGIEECLVGGDVRGVLCTIKALRSTYKFV